MPERTHSTGGKEVMYMTHAELKRMLHEWLRSLKDVQIPEELRSEFPMTDLQLLTYVDGMRKIIRAVLTALNKIQ